VEVMGWGEPAGPDVDDQNYAIEQITTLRRNLATVRGQRDRYQAAWHSALDRQAITRRMMRDLIAANLKRQPQAVETEPGAPWLRFSEGDEVRIVRPKQGSRTYRVTSVDAWALPPTFYLEPAADDNRRDPT
jgi:hypothetical protein